MTTNISSVDALTIQPKSITEKVTEAVISSAIELLAERPAYLCYAAVGACIWGWSGAALGILICGVVDRKIAYDNQFRKNRPLSADAPVRPCSLPGCKHC